MLTKQEIKLARKSKWFDVMQQMKLDGHYDTAAKVRRQIEYLKLYKPRQNKKILALTYLLECEFGEKL